MLNNAGSYLFAIMGGLAGGTILGNAIPVWEADTSPPDQLTSREEAVLLPIKSPGRRPVEQRIRPIEIDHRTSTVHTFPKANMLQETLGRHFSLASRSYLIQKAPGGPFLRESYQVHALDGAQKNPRLHEMGETWILSEYAEHAPSCVPLRSAVSGNTFPLLSLGRERRVFPAHTRQGKPSPSIPSEGLLVDMFHAPKALIRNGKFVLQAVRFRGWILFRGFMPIEVAIREGQDHVVVKLQHVAWARGRVEVPLAGSSPLALLLTHPGASAVKVRLRPGGNFEFGPVPACGIRLQLVGAPVVLERSSRSHMLRTGHQELPVLKTRAVVKVKVLLPGLRNGGRVFFSGWFADEQGHAEAARNLFWPLTEGVWDERGLATFDKLNAGKVAGHVWTENGHLANFPKTALIRAGEAYRITTVVRYPGDLLVNLSCEGMPIPEGFRFVLTDDWYGVPAVVAQRFFRNRSELRVREGTFPRSGSLLVRALWPTRLRWSLVSADGIEVKRGVTSISSHRRTKLDLTIGPGCGELLVQQDGVQPLRITLISRKEGLVLQADVRRERTFPFLPAGTYALVCRRGKEKHRQEIRIKAGQGTRIHVFSKWR